jgi:hypothetical protein
VGLEITKTGRGVDVVEWPDPDIRIENRSPIAPMCNVAIISEALPRWDVLQNKISIAAAKVGFTPSDISEVLVRLEYLSRWKKSDKEFGDETMAFLNRMDGMDDSLPRRAVAGIMPLAIPTAAAATDGSDVAGYTNGALSYDSVSGTVSVRSSDGWVPIGSSVGPSMRERLAVAEAFDAKGERQPKQDEIQSRITALEFDEPSIEGPNKDQISTK